MSSKHIVPALLCASLAVTGCAARPHTALKSDLRDKIGNTEAYAGVRQNELYAQIIPSQAGAAAAGAVAGIPGIGILLAGVVGGVAGAADAGINASRVKENEALVRPLRDTLTDYNFDEQLRQELDGALAANAGLKAAPVRVVKQVEDKHYQKLFEDSKAGAVLFVNTDYSLSPDFSTLTVSSAGLLFARDAALRKAAGHLNTRDAMRGATKADKAIYRNSYVFESKLPAASTDKAQNIAAWQQPGLLRGTLEHGLREMVALMALDLTAVPDAARAKGETVTINNVKAELIAKTETTQRLRFADGTLKATSQPVQQLAAPEAAVPAVTEAAPVAPPGAGAAPAAGSETR